MLQSHPDAGAIGHGAIHTLTDETQDLWFRTAPRTGVPSAWYGHVPFAIWLIEALRPRIVVELGTHNGVSYAAFCDAVARLELDAKCYAVDTWRGDEHAGFYPEQVHTDLAAFHDARYGAFSRMVRTTFDEAAQYFETGTIDLLHIDGCHSYEMVRHDFETWRPLLSSRAVVLFHDTNVREREFGVWRLWDELKREHPGFEFLHSYGLGVLAFGPALDGPMRELCALDDPAEIATIRTRFAMSGRRCMAEAEQTILEQEVAEQKRRLEIVEAARKAAEQEWIEAQADLATRLTASSGEKEEAQRELALLGQQLEASRIDNLRLREALAAAAAQTTALGRELADARTALQGAQAAAAAQQAQFAELSQAHAAALNSTLWRAMGPVRKAAGALPGPLRRSMRRVAQAALRAVKR